MTAPLPIESLKQRFKAILPGERVVLSAPTGSGKSTVIPQWSMEWGRVLVVEPRRVACRGLAARVASLQGSTLGTKVGYIVKQDARASAETNIVFVTTGVALRLIAEGRHHEFATIVLDEFHERSLDLDLILAVLLKKHRGRLIVMSATISGDEIAQHIGGEHLRGTGRTHPVTLHYTDSGPLVPEWRGIESRLAHVLKRLPNDTGDVLVFVPGKAEMHQVMQWIQHQSTAEVIALHGGLTLKQQTRVFEHSAARRFIVATNVAETSITIPGITVVIDTGLERRNVYHQGRGFLTLSVIAQDSADQRAGRAGRTQAGTCFRLWAKHGRLAVRTLPEIHREDLSTLILAAASCGEPPEDLPFLDPPKDYALENATKTLRLLGALTESGTLTSKGQQLFRVPLDPRLGRLLLEAQDQGTLYDVLPLIAALSVGRPLFHAHRPTYEEDDLQAGGCDARALIRAVRDGHVTQNKLMKEALFEARKTLMHLDAEWAPKTSELGMQERNKRLARTLLAAWPDAGYIARKRKRTVHWTNGGTEVQLADQSAIDPNTVEYCIALDTRAIGRTRLKRTILITHAMRANKEWFIDAGLGDERITDTRFESDTVWIKVDREYAKHTLCTQWSTPIGARQLHHAVELGFMSGRLFPKIKQQSEHRVHDRLLHNQLNSLDASIPSLRDWVKQRIHTLGLEDPSDIALLSPQDFLVPDLPPHDRERINKRYPRQLKIGGSTYRCVYDVRKKEAIFEKLDGPTNERLSLQYLPTLKGWRLLLKEKTKHKVLRDKR